MEFVQVVKQDLLDYIATVEKLSAHHTELEQKHKDLIELVAIDQATNKARLFALMDYILESNHASEYSKGLQDAYALIKDGVVANG